MISQAFDWLDEQQANMIADLIELANQNSGSTNIRGLAEVARWLVSWAPFDQAIFRRISLTAREWITDDGHRVMAETGPLLRWDFHPKSDRRVLLAIHYDTVFAADHPFQSCSLLNDDQLQGPGVADAKGGITVLSYALAALCRFNLTADIGWTVVLNPDEEIGSPHSTAVFRQIADEFRFGLLFEPALPSGELVSHRKGSGNFDLVVRGRSAHAGRHFDDGRNAVAMLSRLMHDLDSWNGKYPGTTINVGFVHGGGAVNIVPDVAVGRFNVRLLDDEAKSWFKRRLVELVAQADAREGFSVEMHGGINSPPKPLDDRTRHLMKAVESAHRNCGEPEINWTSTGGVCDGNKLAAAGLPNIDTLGPIGAGLHSTSEWVQLSSLSHKAKVIVDLIHRYAVGEHPELDEALD